MPKTGYLTSYKRKPGVFDAYGDEQRVICSREYLIDLLQHPATCLITVAASVDVQEYIEHHPDEHIDIIGFD